MQTQQQISIFEETKKYKITKPIRLIELFAGYGSQSLALDYLGVKYESWKICEWAVKSIQAYKDLHFGQDNTDYSVNLTKDEIVNYLFNKGISSNYNEPMKLQQIQRLKEDEVRAIYNNIKSTHNLVSVCNAKGKDFEIVDTDKYEYIMTYSFPCQDLSVCGLGRGMQKGSGTRSGLLWEVERILGELQNKPQVLVMENVPQVISEKNKQDFDKWLLALKNMGYKNYYKVINANEFGIPQNRKRCFMVSILDNYYIDIPQSIGREYWLNNFLDRNVKEEYYLSANDVNRILSWKAQQKPFKGINEPKKICPCITARGAGEDHSGMILVNELVEVVDGYNQNIRYTDYLGTITRNVGADLKRNGQGFIEEKTKIRKITEHECWKLMGVTTEDYNKVVNNQNKSSMYHLAGDSIVTTCLMTIFGELLGIDYIKQVKKLVEQLVEEKHIKEN